MFILLYIRDVRKREGFIALIVRASDYDYYLFEESLLYGLKFEWKREVG